MRTTTATINVAQQAKRRARVDAARHSSAMEGQRSSAEAWADQEEYVRGEATLEELLERSRARHGIA